VNCRRFACASVPIPLVRSGRDPAGPPMPIPGSRRRCLPHPPPGGWRNRRG